jgi:1,4-dihydroxy-2-naphthoate octaprenyltransferase
MHLSDDYFDRDNDQTDQRTLVSGESGMIYECLPMTPLVLRMAIILLIDSVVLAEFFPFYYLIPPIHCLFTILGAVLGWSHTAPPLKLAFRGLGEVATAIASGFYHPIFGVHHRI